MTFSFENGLFMWNLLRSLVGGADHGVPRAVAGHHRGVCRVEAIRAGRAGSAVFAVGAVFAVRTIGARRSRRTGRAGWSWRTGRPRHARPPAGTRRPRRSG